MQFGAGPTNIATNSIEVHEYDPGVSFSIAFEHVQRNKMNWSVGIQYAIKGYTSDLIVLNDMGQAVDVESNPVIVDYSYIGLPMKIGFMKGHRFYQFGNFGICPSYHLSTTFTYEEFNISDFPPGNNIVGVGYEEMPFHKFDFSTLGELGLGYELSSRFDLYSSLQAEYSLTNLAKDYDTTVDNPVARHYGFAINFGARVSLPGK